MAYDQKESPLRRLQDYVRNRGKAGGLCTEPSETLGTSLQGTQRPPTHEDPSNRTNMVRKNGMCVYVYIEYMVCSTWYIYI